MTAGAKTIPTEGREVVLHLVDRAYHSVPTVPGLHYLSECSHVRFGWGRLSCPCTRLRYPHPFPLHTSRARLLWYRKRLADIVV